MSASEEESSTLVRGTLGRLSNRLRSTIRRSNNSNNTGGGGGGRGKADIIIFLHSFTYTPLYTELRSVADEKPFSPESFALIPTTAATKAEAATPVRPLRPKHCVLCVGQTGSGKSATASRLALRRAGSSAGMEPETK